MLWPRGTIFFFQPKGSIIRHNFAYWFLLLLGDAASVAAKPPGLTETTIHKPHPHSHFKRRNTVPSLLPSVQGTYKVIEGDLFNWSMTMYILYSIKPRFSILDFVFSRAVRQNPEWKAWVQGYIIMASVHQL